MSKKSATQTRPKPAGPTAPEPEQNREEAPELEQNREEAPEPEQEAEKPQDKKKPKLPDFLMPYVEAYPKSRVFHATTDRMVFLEADLDMARAHQIGLGGGEVKTYKVK